MKGEDPQSIPGTDVEQIISTFKRLRYKYRDKIHEAELKIYSEIAESLFEMRLIKVVENREIRDSFDSWQNEVVDKMRSFYVNYLTGAYVNRDGKVLCEVKSGMKMDGIELRQGDYVILSLKKAFSLWLAGYVEPCKVERK
ncbi:hypothetical protein L3N51_01035 [Metallosphaera sp. J1]|uniref:hypothetical protein n=1 Tax=Metallosphaera TaxID=41980 RepID=UPI001EDF64B3|nr:hypothetical protein [Metallosphaera javensis (ex Hofmann et al. 2022)]MCG3108749.1 hypothetical protein [Metallosphaera javensis (ex Hofmann et al. 2022)]BCS94338.1 MAG: archaeal homolog of GINS complex proteins Psf1/Sld5 [Metallosphaera javensis (ex Sakai et al. 2022)]